MNLRNVANEGWPISEITLLMLAADRSFHKSLAYLLVWNLFILSVFLFGGLSIAEFLLCALLINTGIFMFAIHSSFEAKCGWYNVKAAWKLLKHKEWMRRLKGLRLLQRNCGWEYWDTEWFVRINKFSACILFAPALDFSKPAVHTKQLIYDDFTRKRIYAKSKQFDQYTFCALDASSITIQIDQMEFLLKWIADHGGRTVTVLKP